MWSWIFDGREPETRQASGWSGTLSLPRVLWLGDDKTLRMAPVEELSALRTNPRTYEALAVRDGEELWVDQVTGNSLELSLEVRSGEAKRVGVKVCCSPPGAPTGAEETVLFYDAVERKLKIDTSRSSLGEGPKSVEGGPLDLGPDEVLKLRVFVDRSVVEVFANDRQAVMRRNSVSVCLFSEGADVVVERLQAWDMTPSVPW
jgi:beta-fructofuranosidase